jgi:hypothetical protein
MFEVNKQESRDQLLSRVKKQHPICKGNEPSIVFFEEIQQGNYNTTIGIASRTTRTKHSLLARSLCIQPPFITRRQHRTYLNRESCESIHYRCKLKSLHKRRVNKPAQYRLEFRNSTHSWKRKQHRDNQFQKI